MSRTVFFYKQENFYFVILIPICVDYCNCLSTEFQVYLFPAHQAQRYPASIFTILRTYLCLIGPFIIFTCLSFIHTILNIHTITLQIIVRIFILFFLSFMFNPFSVPYYNNFRKTISVFLFNLPRFILTFLFSCPYNRYGQIDRRRLRMHHAQRINSD